MTSADKSADKFSGESLPGTLWKCHGAWHWRVTLPGAEKRKDYTLTMPFTGARIPADASISLAESAAWRLWENAARQIDAGHDAPAFTVNDLCDRWAAHAAKYYSGSNEATDCVSGLRLFREMFGRRPAEAMTHPDMIAYRNALVAKDYVRTTVNKYLGYAKRMFAWALDERLISAQLKAECTAISSIKPHRGSVREGKPVCAIDDATVEKTCREMPPSLADMVRVHRLCGARPDEMCGMAWELIEKRKRIWVYRPGNHKNKWRNKPRAIVLGPRAQAILAKYADVGGVKVPGPCYIFSPQLALVESYRRVIEGAKCHRRNVKGSPRMVGLKWNTNSYNKAVANAVEKVKAKTPAKDRDKFPCWHPNQLRHTCATEVRRRFGIDAASAVLGHTLGLRITNRYSFEAAEDDMINAATPAMMELG